MKKVICLLFLSFLFCCISCESEKDQSRYHLVIKNNSDQTLFIVISRWSSIARDTVCWKPTTTMERHSTIHHSTIPPQSSQNKVVDSVVDYLKAHPEDKGSVGVFFWDDIDRMTCEDFKRLYPLKKEWTFTLEDMEACDWTLVYSPEE